MATHSSVLAWRVPGKGEPGGLPSMGSEFCPMWTYFVAHRPLSAHCFLIWQKGQSSSLGAGSKPHAAPQPWGLAPGRQVQFTSRSHREPGEAETSPEKTHTLWDPGQKQLIATEPGADRPTYCSCRVPKEAGGILGTDPGASISGSLFYPGCAGEHQFGILPLAQQPAGTSLTRHLTGHPLI